MRQRVRALNGDFRISGRPGAGTKIEVFIPLAADGAAPQDAPDAGARGRAPAASAAD